MELPSTVWIAAVRGDTQEYACTQDVAAWLDEGGGVDASSAEYDATLLMGAGVGRMMLMGAGVGWTPPCLPTPAPISSRRTAPPPPAEANGMQRFLCGAADALLLLGASIYAVQNGYSVTQRTPTHRTHAKVAGGDR